MMIERKAGSQVSGEEIFASFPCKQYLRLLPIASLYFLLASALPLRGFEKVLHASR